MQVAVGSEGGAAPGGRPEVNHSGESSFMRARAWGAQGTAERLHAREHSGRPCGCGDPPVTEAAWVVLPWPAESFLTPHTVLGFLPGTPRGRQHLVSAPPALLRLWAARGWVSELRKRA